MCACGVCHTDSPSLLNTRMEGSTPGCVGQNRSDLLRHGRNDLLSPHLTGRSPPGSGPLMVLGIFKDDVSRGGTRDSTRGAGRGYYPDSPLSDLARNATPLLYSPRFGPRTFSSYRIPFPSDKVCADLTIVPGRPSPGGWAHLIAALIWLKPSAQFTFYLIIPKAE